MFTDNGKTLLTRMGDILKCREVEFGRYWYSEDRPDGNTFIQLHMNLQRARISASVSVQRTLNVEYLTLMLRRD